MRIASSNKSNLKSLSKGRKSRSGRTKQGVPQLLSKNSKYNVNGTASNARKAQAWMRSKRTKPCISQLLSKKSR